MVRRFNGRPSWLTMFAVLAALAVAAPALAQGTVKGTVVDSGGKPVEGAKVVIELQGGARTAHFEAKTDKKGEFFQVGLPLGSYKLTAEKDAAGSAPATTNVRSGVGVPINLVLNTVAAAEVAKSGALKKTFDEAVALADAGNHAGAIEKFNAAIQINGKCNDCYDNIATLYSQDKQYDKAESAFKKAIDINPNDVDAYNGLATVYNAQKKFDDAANASKKAASLSGGIGASAGGNADSLYNQGVALFNGGKAGEAKPLFEQAIQVKPDHADAHYMLGMTLAGSDPAKAVAEFQTYLTLAPAGKNAELAKQFISALPH
jgi:tetratricopeptide (TPR) repeat protein